MPCHYVRGEESNPIIERGRIILYSGSSQARSEPLLIAFLLLPLLPLNISLHKLNETMKIKRQNVGISLRFICLARHNSLFPYQTDERARGDFVCIAQHRRGRGGDGQSSPRLSPQEQKSSLS